MTETPVITIAGQRSVRAKLRDAVAYDLIHRGFTVLEDEGPIPAGEGMVVLRTVRPADETDVGAQLNAVRDMIHTLNVAAGWWTNLDTGEPLQRNVGELLCLVHSEISEAMEGHRKGLPDDKLPHRPMIEVELADAMIRIFDLAGGLGLDLGGALVEKLAYNAVREDHKLEIRKAAGGKRY